MKKKLKKDQPSLRFIIIALFLTLAVIPGLILIIFSWYQFQIIVDHDLSIIVSNPEQYSSYADRQAVLEATVSSLRQWGFIFFLGYLAIVGPLLWYFSGRLTRPLRLLEIRAQRLADGNLADAASTGVDTRWLFRELQSLIRAFDTMRGRIIESYQELESQVAERTWDLHSKVHEVQRAEQELFGLNKQLGEALAENERQKVVLQDVIDKMPVGVLITRTPNGKPEFINKHAEDLLGDPVAGATTYSERYNFYTRDGSAVYPSDSLPINKAFVSKKGSYTEDIRLKKKDDDFIYLYAQTAVIYDKVGNVELSIMVFDDITARKEIERQKSEFVSVVSHQLRTPLSAVRWFVELLLDKKTGKLTKTQKEYIEHIYQSNLRLIDLVNGLLNVSRIEAGRVAIEPVLTDPVAFVRAMVKDMTPLLKQHKQKVKIIAAKDIPKVSFDPKLISQVIVNLLSNAIKYSSESSTTTVELRRDDKELYISIADSGLGIPKKSQQQVFTKFFRADNVVKKETEGTGLGLYVVRQVVVASGGRIWFTSEENIGTTFTFTLPLAGSQAVKGEKKLI